MVLDETRSTSSSPTRRKRPRYDDDSEEVVLQLQRPPGSEPDVVRDDKYYFSDGSFVLQVENTLFNVHKSRLATDNSTFRAMFDMPEPSSSQEQCGTSDDNPLVLNGDTVSEFKNFLWALYAMPYEFVDVHNVSLDPKPHRLMDIARVANKYCFKGLEMWVLDYLDEYVSTKPCPILLRASYPMSSDERASILATNHDTLSRLVRLAQLCAHERLLATMVAILRQLMSQSLPYAYLAISLADELGLRTLRGVAYFEVMQKAVPVTPAGAGAAVDAPPYGTIDEEGQIVVTQEQRLRLLAGHYHLSRTWDRLRAKPLPFNHAAGCSATWHQHGCTQSWLDFWKEKTKCDAILGLGVADLPGRLRAISKEFDRWGSATYMHHDCRMMAKKAITEKVKEVEESLPDYFVDEHE